LETLLDLLQKAGEQTHLTEIYELLAHAYTQSGDFEKARDYYLKLTQLEPHNQLHADNYQQVASKLGTTTTSRGLITAEEGSVMWMSSKLLQRSSNSAMPMKLRWQCERPSPMQNSSLLTTWQRRR